MRTSRGEARRGDLEAVASAWRARKRKVDTQNAKGQLNTSPRHIYHKPVPGGSVSDLLPRPVRSLGLSPLLFLFHPTEAIASDQEYPKCASLPPPSSPSSPRV